MTSKDIIIRLIDESKITGEEAYVLLNDIFKGEMVAVNEILHKSSKTLDSGNWWLNTANTITANTTCSNPYTLTKN